MVPVSAMLTTPWVLTLSRDVPPLYSSRTSVVHVWNIYGGTLCQTRRKLVFEHLCKATASILLDHPFHTVVAIK
jgi:hypothetical protein